MKEDEKFLEITREVILLNPSNETISDIIEMLKNHMKWKGAVQESPEFKHAKQFFENWGMRN